MLNSLVAEWLRGSDYRRSRRPPVARRRTKPARPAARRRGRTA